ncbi:MAG: Hsp20/alpha crystallin family protein [Dehalococcoidia bacterium]
MTLQRWAPFAGWRTLDTFGPHLWHGAFAPRPRNGADVAWTIPIDVTEDDAGLTVRASLPGIAPDDVKVEIDDGVLNIRAQTETGEDVAQSGYLRRERRSGSFHRSLRLPDTVDEDGITSVYANGVLTISLPKSEAKKARQVPIEVA